VALYDGREGSATRGEVNEFFVGERNPLLISVPPMVYHGFKALGKETAYFLSVPSHPYDYRQPDEFRLSPDSDLIPYDWLLEPGKKHG
jgi:dTDP-4-dehydrorhamnose 3,5-epimerase